MALCPLHPTRHGPPRALAVPEAILGNVPTACFQDSWGSCLALHPGRIINEGSASRELASAS